MVGGDLMELPALFVQPDPAAFAILVIVRDVHAHHGRDAGEGVDHRRDQSAVAQAHQVGHIDRIQESSRFKSREHRRLAAFDHMFGSADRGGRIVGHDLPDDEPVEEHPDGGQVLFHGRW